MNHQAHVRQWVQVDAVSAQAGFIYYTLHHRLGLAKLDTKVCRTAKKAWPAESHQKYAMSHAGFLMIKHVTLPH